MNPAESTTWLKSLIRPHLWSLAPYSSARHEFNAEAEIWLDANENPFDSAHEHRNRYPEPLQPEVRALACRYFDCHEEELFIGNGSDEAIDLIIRACCEPGRDQIVICPPTYGMYEVSAGIHNAGVIRVPLVDESFDLHMEALSAELAKLTSKVLFLCSPNNPTGTLLLREHIELILNSYHGLVVVDQAYFEFSAHDLLTEKAYWKTLQARFPQLVLLRTLSKAWGAAALRVGFAIGNPPFISILNKIKPPYNISEPVQEEAVKRLNQYDQVLEEVRLIISERERLAKALSDLNSVRRVIPSSGNFLLVEFEQSDRLFNALISAGIVVRNRSRQIPGTLRITVGTPAENERLLAELSRLVS